MCCGVKCSSGLIVMLILWRSNMYGDNIISEVAKALGVELDEPICVENSTDRGE